LPVDSPMVKLVKEEGKSVFSVVLYCFCKQARSRNRLYRQKNRYSQEFWGVVENVN
jgi:hypothetical protein